jgi:hypothetical protein
MRVSSIACTTVALLLFGGNVRALGSLPEANEMPTAQESIVNRQEGGFANALDGMARDHRITFVCEGVPMQTELSKTDLAKLIDRMQGMSTLKEKIGTLAAAYDYDCDWKTDNLCLLRKRFTEEDDMPDVSAGEAIRSLENILSLWRPFEPQYDGIAATKRLISGLTPEWQARLANESVPVADLPESVRTSLRSLVFGRISDRPIMGTRYLLFRLSQCAKKKGVTFSKKDLFSLGAPIPVYSENCTVIGAFNGIWIYRYPLPLTRRLPPVQQSAHSSRVTQKPSMMRPPSKR